MAVSENNRKFAIGKQRLGIMVEINDRKLPVGIQSFEKIRKDGYLYVDKTDIIWQLANKGKTYNYLSRPRRFGKSVLVDTLEAYFMGKKELFEGLKIMQMETEWVKRPVIRLDMSRAGAEPESLKGYLDYTPPTSQRPPSPLNTKSPAKKNSDAGSRPPLKPIPTSSQSGEERS